MPSPRRQASPSSAFSGAVLPKLEGAVAARLPGRCGRDDRWLWPVPTASVQWLAGQLWSVGVTGCLIADSARLTAAPLGRAAARGSPGFIPAMTVSSPTAARSAPKMPRVGDLDLAQVTVPECRAREVLAREAGTPELAGAPVVGCHRVIVPDQPAWGQPPAWSLAGLRAQNLPATPAASAITAIPGHSADRR